MLTETKSTIECKDGRGAKQKPTMVSRPGALNGAFNHQLWSLLSNDLSWMVPLGKNILKQFWCYGFF